ncbi:YceD family protein [Pedosphaera parvula]|uniref:DUF177 domain-containing protein n=1 Tax=Pedosphaera parvula (strain Ellin514) TaxID=320771 RepID=B9XBG5_PEDPL|nr:YceD family protein [Pedosphaera parvula]EEF62850.1 protein of unknown function DUF177 [Pedosphaera parvula Ellin514]
MALLINLRHLENQDLHVQGELSAGELDIDFQDELVRVVQPLKYDLEIQRLETSLLVQGSLDLALDCDCARCLKEFKYPLDLENWTCHVPLEGEESAPILNDCVDLTPYIREDILLEFPQHPLCKPECSGLPKKVTGKSKKTGGTGQTKEISSAWAELNKLKF